MSVSPCFRRYQGHVTLVNQSDQAEAIPQGHQERLQSLLGNDLVIEPANRRDVQAPLLLVVHLAVGPRRVGDMPPAKHVVRNNEAAWAEEAMRASGPRTVQHNGQVVRVARLVGVEKNDVVGRIGA